MAKKDEPTDAQLLSRLRRSGAPRTAASLGTTAARLRALDGVVEAGRVKTGKAGRPAILFAASREEAVDHDRLDPSAAARSTDPGANPSTIDVGERDAQGGRSI